MCKLLSRVQLFVTSWTIVCQASLSTGFSRQESWSGLPFPPPGDVSYPGIEPMFLVAPALQTASVLLSPQGTKQTKSHNFFCVYHFSGVNISTIASFQPLLNVDLKRMLATVSLGQNKPTPAHRCISLLMQMRGSGPQMYISLCNSNIEVLCHLQCKMDNLSL